MKKVIAVALVALTVSFARAAHGQDTIPSTTSTAIGEQLVDRVIAVVGDTILLLSDIQVQLQQMQASGRTLPEDPAQRSQLVDQLVSERVEQLVLLEAARQAAIPVEEGEVSDLVEQEIQAVLERFNGSESALRTELAASGMTLEQYRDILTNQFRDRLMIDRFLRQRAANAPSPPVSDEEIRAAFEAQQASLGERPANVSFQQVIIEPEPSDSARAQARDTAEQVLRELVEGGDFEVLARRYSDDPGTRERGGDLGWFRPGRMVPEFEQAIRAMRPGQTSNIVETEFGFHIIRLEKARGPERQARHILIRPEVTEADRVRARELADSLAAAARAGANFDQMVQTYMAPEEQQPVQRIPLDRLPPAYATEYGDAEAGDVVGPFEIEGPNGPQWVVAKITGRQERGAYTLADVRDQLRARLEEQKIIEDLVAELRRGMFVEVMM